MERLVRGDQIVVISGKDRGKQGAIVRREGDGRYLIKGINLVKKHTKPDPVSGISNGISETEMPIHGSNVALLHSDTGKIDKVSFKKLDKGRKIRVFKSTGEVVGSS